MSENHFSVSFLLFFFSVISLDQNVYHAYLKSPLLWNCMFFFSHFDADLLLKLDSFCDQISNYSVIWNLTAPNNIYFIQDMHKLD